MISDVYLDHFITREAFLYKSAQDFSSARPNSTLRVSLLQQLNSGTELRSSFRRQLRKPDFQRATWAWTPQQCVDLLDSVLKSRVVPSVILWASPDNFIYVLDGGHRISVLLAYLTDDWGDKNTQFLNSLQIEQSRKVAFEVRERLQRKSIASFADHQTADALYWQLYEAQSGPEKDDNQIRIQMGVRDWDLASKYRSWSFEEVGFPIQWVAGNYNDAEESFLRINSSGTNLSNWEITLVRHRQSSFARMVTSLAYPDFMNRYWPRRDRDNEPLSASAESHADQIPGLCNQIAGLLWEPRNAPPNSRLRPLLVASAAIPESQPFYIGELLTVVQGQQGQPTQTLALMERSQSPDPERILADGHDLALKTVEALNHLRGRTVYSLGVVSAAYFFNAEGIPVRSLFYGFLFWINYGTKAEVQKRKEIFCAFRGIFEAKLLKHKSDIVRRISRRIGSGGEVTFQTARYFNGLLETIIEHAENPDSVAFDTAHISLLEDLRKTPAKVGSQGELNAAASDGLASRVASFRQRSRIALEQELQSMPTCGICEGRLLNDDPQNAVQFDHVVPHSEGGPTNDRNLRPTHAFCNHRRVAIESQRSKTDSLPSFIDSQGRDQQSQLTFSELWSNPEEDSATPYEDRESNDGESGELNGEMDFAEEADN